MLIKHVISLDSFPFMTLRLGRKFKFASSASHLLGILIYSLAIFAIKFHTIQKQICQIATDKKNSSSHRSRNPLEIRIVIKSYHICSGIGVAPMFTSIVAEGGYYPLRYKLNHLTGTVF